jgi:hypothetical protein
VINKPARALRLPVPGDPRRLLRRLAGAVLALAGIVFLIVGAALLASQRWTPVTATVQSCTTRATHATSGSTRYDQVCTVSWQDPAGPRTATVDFGQARTAPGTDARIRVHGGSAVLATPAWAGYAVLGAGLLLAGAGAVVSIRAWRR